MNEYFTVVGLVLLLDLVLSAILILVFRKRFVQLFKLHVRRVITEVEGENIENEMAYEEYRRSEKYYEECGRSDEYNESYGE